MHGPVAHLVGCLSTSPGKESATGVWGQRPQWLAFFASQSLLEGQKCARLLTRKSAKCTAWKSATPESGDIGARRGEVVRPEANHRRRFAMSARLLGFSVWIVPP